ncbi:hypothetical protein C5S32_00160, partial [ANME-1 cluster archaeon GoMg1]|nr:hypothetical protein [ANME-1 cluster archaeon GoMg1]
MIFFLVCSTFSFVCPKTYISFVAYYKCYFSAALYSPNLQTAPSARTTMRIRQILTTRSSASFFIIELVSVEDGTVKVRLSGACAGCPMSQFTLVNFVEATLKKIDIAKQLPKE